MLILISTFIVGIVILAGVLMWLSPGKVAPLLDEKGNIQEGSISEKIYLNINGQKQGIFLKSKDSTLPVLLFLHGGIPVYYLTKNYPTGLESFFTVAWWDQRGAGISYTSNNPPETMTLEQMISDAKEVTNYLRKRFGKEKIYLMGHSGGTFIGLNLAVQAPELYHAYIAMAQMTDQLKSEKLAYDYMLEQFGLKGNEKMHRKLASAKVSITEGIPDSYLSLRDEAMHSLGVGTTHDMKSIITGIFLPSLANREYTLYEKYKFWRAKSKSGVSTLWDTILKTDLSEKVPEMAVPVYFFHGIHDYTVSYTLAKTYFEKLNAPMKGFYTFEKSAHSPFFEEPEKVLQIIQLDVLDGKNNLADLK